MGQEDRLKKQIDQLAKALAAILSRLTGFDQVTAPDAFESLNAGFKNELKFDLDELIEIPDEALVDHLKNNYKLNNGHFNILADIIYLAAADLQTTDAAKARKLFGKALALYKHLAATEKNYSLHWHNRIAEITSV